MSAEDVDVDSSMHSSLSDSPSGNNDDDVDLFLDTAEITTDHRPTTPNDHLNALAPGELSPPRSQSDPRQPGLLPDAGEDPDDGFTMMDGGGEAVGNGDGNGAVTLGLSEGAEGERTTIAGNSNATLKPGAGWKSKRAQEEYQKAMESVVDKDFTLRGFGDILDDGMGKR